MKFFQKYFNQSDNLTETINDIISNSPSSALQYERSRRDDLNINDFLIFKMVRVSDRIIGVSIAKSKDGTYEYVYDGEIPFRDGVVKKEEIQAYIDESMNNAEKELKKKYYSLCLMGSILVGQTMKL